MPLTSQFEKIGRIHERAFELAAKSMPSEKIIAYQGWLATHPEYVPSFGARMEAALGWTKQNPDKFGAMLVSFDTAIEFLNHSTAHVDATTFPNIANYKRNRKGSLPLLLDQSKDPARRSAPLIMHAARDSATKLRLGETIKPDDTDFYSFHTFVKSDQGMVAASLIDLYENYARTLGLYPDEHRGGAIIADAITEAVFLTKPDGILFQSLKNPDDGWIDGYAGFSAQFQQAVYGQSSAQQLK